MRAIAALLVLLATAPAVAADDGAPREARLAHGLAAALVERRATLRPRTHATDFGNDAIGCITLTRRELRRFGYAGHAFLCEEGATAEVAGAVLDRSGRVRCLIAGFYAGDFCYDFEICGVREVACVS